MGYANLRGMCGTRNFLTHSATIYQRVIDVYRNILFRICPESGVMYTSVANISKVVLRVEAKTIISQICKSSGMEWPNEQVLALRNALTNMQKWVDGNGRFLCGGWRSWR